MLSRGRRGPEVGEPFPEDVAEDRFGVLLPLSSEPWWTGGEGPLWHRPYAEGQGGSRDVRLQGTEGNHRTSCIRGQGLPCRPVTCAVVDMGCAWLTAFRHHLKLSHNL